MKKIVFLLAFFLLLISTSFAQSKVGNYLGDESRFYASTKQINQFFRRFNAEEDPKGDRIYKGNKRYRNAKLRKKYIRVLFDNETSALDNALKSIFINDVTGSNSKFLGFHNGKWFAEVHTVFNYKGKKETAILFLKIQEEPVGSKWVIDKVHFEPFNKLFNFDSTDTKTFIHPMSHELDFMNLHKAFRKKKEIEKYTSRSYRPDHLTLFLLEVKKSNLTFQSIKNVKFHFFQVDNWYFELSEFNRGGHNTGWLISNLTKLNEKQKVSYKKFIYFEN